MLPCQCSEGGAPASPPSYCKSVVRPSISKKTSTRTLTDGPAAVKIHAQSHSRVVSMSRRSAITSEAIQLVLVQSITVVQRTIRNTDRLSSYSWLPE